MLETVLEPGFLEKVRETGELLGRELAALVLRHPTVFEGEARGLGLLRGVQGIPANTKVVEALRGNGLLTVGASDNVVRLLPPLIVSPGEIAEAIAILDRTAAALAKEETAL